MGNLVVTLGLTDSPMWATTDIVTENLAVTLGPQVLLYLAQCMTKRCDGFPLRMLSMCHKITNNLRVCRATMPNIRADGQEDFENTTSLLRRDQKYAQHHHDEQDR
jgi:hypothetical protein